MQSMTRLLLTGSLFALTLNACATNPAIARRSDPAKDYFDAASRCMDLAARKQPIRIPTDQSYTAVEIPLPHDAALFGDCMEKSGFPPPKADPKPYLSSVRQCLAAAKSAPDPKAAYANCARRNSIAENIEIIAPQN